MFENENKVSQSVLDTIERMGWQNNGIKDTGGQYTAYICNLDYDFMQSIDTGFGFDGTSDGLSNAIKERADWLKSADKDSIAEKIAEQENADIKVVREELQRYSADIERLYTGVELTCIKDNIQELKDTVSNLYEHTATQTRSADKVKPSRNEHMSDR